MRATMLTSVRGIELRQVSDPVIHFPTDAVVTVTASCVCGSDLHGYRGHATRALPRRIGHEFIGLVSDTGSGVSTVKAGDLVIAPFAISDGTCVHCHNGLPTSCVQGSFWGAPDRAGVLADGAQAEQVRVPLADGTLVRVSGPINEQLVPDLLALSDVMATGHHAAVSAGVKPDSTVVIVGDGAVGLCAVLASARLGADRVIAMSRHGSRQKLATEFGATDIVAERGPEGAAQVMELLAGVGADCTLECVGTQDAIDQAVAVTRPGGMLGCVGAPFYTIPAARLAPANIGLRGGVAPVRAYLPALLDDVLAGIIHPGKVFVLELPLQDVAEAYRAMDERRAIKVLLRP
jgi:threonine dehydrogenase-like Zn-dependent dehydrogenase